MLIYCFLLGIGIGLVYVQQSAQAIKGEMFCLAYARFALVKKRKLDFPHSTDTKKGYHNMGTVVKHFFGLNVGWDDN